MPWRLAGKRRDRSDFRFASCLVRVAMSEGADTAMALRTLEPRSDVLGDDEDTWPTQFTAEYWTSRNVFVLTTTTADGQRRAWDVWNEKTLMMNESHNLEHAKESATMSRTPFASLCARARQCHSSPRSPTYAARAPPGAISRFFPRRKSPPRHAKATDAAAAPDEGPSSPGGGADESVLPVGTAGEGGLEAGESPVRPLARRREQHPPVSFIADGTASRGACFYLVAKDSCLPSRAVYKVWAARRDGFRRRIHVDFVSSDISTTRSARIRCAWAVSNRQYGPGDESYTHVDVRLDGSRTSFELTEAELTMSDGDYFFLRFKTYGSDARLFPSLTIAADSLTPVERNSQLRIRLVYEKDDRSLFAL